MSKRDFSGFVPFEEELVGVPVAVLRDCGGKIPVHTSPGLHDVLKPAERREIAQMISEWLKQDGGPRWGWGTGRDVTLKASGREVSCADAALHGRPEDGSKGFVFWRKGEEG